MRSLILICLSLVVVTGCGSTAVAPAPVAAAPHGMNLDLPPAHVAPRSTVVAERAPETQLPNGVTPTHYAIELTIDPDKADFKGDVTIDVDLATPTNLIWIHEKDSFSF